jgi:hypothetical protein
MALLEYRLNSGGYSRGVFARAAESVVVRHLVQEQNSLEYVCLAAPVWSDENGQMGVELDRRV